MIQTAIVRHLQNGGVAYSHQWHTRAIDAQSIAQALHVSGTRIAKSVIVEAGGKRWMAVLPANRRLDLLRFAEAVNAPAARLVEENEFAPLFEGCEPGAEPPFGRLYGLPVVLDAAFRADQRLIMRAGNHEETIELDYDDFARLEQPMVAGISSSDLAPQGTVLH